MSFHINEQWSSGWVWCVHACAQRLLYPPHTDITNFFFPTERWEFHGHLFLIINNLKHLNKQCKVMKVAWAESSALYCTVPVYHCNIIWMWCVRYVFIYCLAVLVIEDIEFRCVLQLSRPKGIQVTIGFSNWICILGFVVFLFVDIAKRHLWHYGMAHSLLATSTALASIDSFHLNYTLLIFIHTNVYNMSVPIIVILWLLFIFRKPPFVCSS